MLFGPWFVNTPLIQDMLYRFFTERYVLPDIAHLGAFDFLQAVVTYSDANRVSLFPVC